MRQLCNISASSKLRVLIHQPATYPANHFQHVSRQLRVCFAVLPLWRVSWVASPQLRNLQLSGLLVDEGPSAVHVFAGGSAGGIGSNIAQLQQGPDASATR
jgi:hypothetical protein